MNSPEIDNLRILLLSGLKSPEDRNLAMELIEGQGLHVELFSDLLMLWMIRIREWPIRNQFRLRLWKILYVRASPENRAVFEKGEDELRSGGKQPWKVYDEISALPETDAAAMRRWASNVENTAANTFFIHRATPEEFARLYGNLKTFSFRNGSLEVFPPGLRGLPQLEILDLTNNSISELPEWIGELKDLRYLDLSRNQVAELPDSLSGLTGLTNLNLANNPIETFPAVLSKISSLQSLSLDSNSLRSFDQIEALPLHLHHISLRGRHVESIPATIGRFKNLRYLELTAPECSYLPAEIEGLTALDTLDIQSTYLETLPPEIAQIPLKSLRMEGSYLHTLSPAQLPDSITDLYIYGADEEVDWGKAIGHLRNLRHLVIDHGNGGTFPDSMPGFPELITLVLEVFDILKLPACFRHSTKLELLDISLTDMVEIPEWVTNFSNLKTLCTAQCDNLDYNTVHQYAGQATLVLEGDNRMTALMSTGRDIPQDCRPPWFYPAPAADVYPPF